MSLLVISGLRPVIMTTLPLNDPTLSYPTSPSILLSVGWLPCSIGKANNCPTQIGISYGQESWSGWYRWRVRFPPIIYWSVVLDRWSILWLEAVLCLYFAPESWTLWRGYWRGSRMIFCFHSTNPFFAGLYPADIPWMCGSDNEWGQQFGMVWYGT